MARGHRDCDPTQGEWKDADLQHTSTTPFIHHHAAQEGANGRRGGVYTRCENKRNVCGEKTFGCGSIGDVWDPVGGE